MSKSDPEADSASRPAAANRVGAVYVEVIQSVRWPPQQAEIEPDPNPELAGFTPEYRQAVLNRRAKDAAKPKPPATPAPPAPAKVVQFPLPFPQDKPPVCNVIARSALFAAIKSKDRRNLDHELIVSQDGVTISFTGWQLNQDDHDLFMQLIKLAAGHPFGQDVVVPANAILRALGRSTGKSQHDKLRVDLDRLVSGTVTIRAKGIEYLGHLIDSALQDTRQPVNKRHWAYSLNTKIAALFAPNQFTLSNWEARQKLAQKELARWLQLWLESHAQNFATGVETIRDRCGSLNKDLSGFRQQLRLALDDLKTTSVIHNWEIDAGDLVHIERTPSPTQLGHVRKKTARKTPGMATKQLR